MLTIQVWHILLVILAVLLAVTIARSVRKAFSRPGPSTQAVQAFSLATGRSMVLVGIIVASVSSRRLQDWTGSAATTVGLVGIAGLALQLLSETRWPRQSGAVRVAMLRRPTLSETVRARYHFGVAAAGLCASVAVVFALVLGPAVNRFGDVSVATPGCPAEPGATCTYTHDGVITTVMVPDEAPASGAVMVTVACLLLMLAVAAVAVRQVLRRPMLVGVDPSTDQGLRRVAAQRVYRLVTAALLAFTATTTTQVRDALDARDLDAFGPQPGSLPRALTDFLSVIQVACLLGILLLYMVGPNQSTLRRALLPSRTPTNA